MSENENDASDTDDNDVIKGHIAAEVAAKRLTQDQADVLIRDLDQQQLLVDSAEPAAGAGGVVEIAGHTFKFGQVGIQELRGAFQIRHDAELYDIDVFAAGRCEPIPGGTRRMTRAHTNIPKGGYNGLPKDWEFAVLNWRASFNLPYEQPLLDWAAETSVQFMYNESCVGDAVLADLLFGARRLGTNGLPVLMRENLGYRATVRTENARVFDNLIDWLKRTSEYMALQEVKDAMMVVKSDKALDSLRRAVKLLDVEPRDLTGWIHLEGYMNRVVVGA